MNIGLSTAVALAAGLMMAAQAAQAGADIAPPPDPEPIAPARTPWEGLYVGPTIGFSFTENEIDAAAPGFPVETDPDGLVASGQVGYNFRSGNRIYGVVGDFTFMNVEDAQTNPGAAWRTEYSWSLSLRGRMGVLATENALVYGHGGVAYAEIENTYVAGFGGGPGDLIFSDQEFGYVVGAGAEIMAIEKVSVFAEYSFMGFGDPDSVVSPAGPTDFDNDPLHLFKLGLNFHF